MVWAACLLVWPVFIANTALAETKTGSDPESYAVYDVYAGGIHGVEARLEMTLNKPGFYSLSLSTQTRGFLGKIVPWHGLFLSEGIQNGDYYQPTLHKSIATWMGETEIRTYEYEDGNLTSIVFAEFGKEAEVREMIPELTENTTDVLTATLLVMQKVANGGSCDGVSNIFDGKRRFEVAFWLKDKTTLKANKYNIYNGLAQECVVEVTPKGGKWHKKPRGWLSLQEQGRDRGTMPTVWFAKLSEDGPAYPIKIRMKTAFGTFFMHLSEYKNGDELLIVQNREEN